MSTRGQVAATLKRQKNMVARLLRLGVARKLDSVVSQADSSAKVRAALWLVAQRVSRLALGLRLGLAVLTQKFFPSNGESEV